MGYTTHADSDLVGLGVSAISHIGDSFSQNPRDLPSWQLAIDEGRLPVFRGMRLDEDDLLRADLIQQLICQAQNPIGALERSYALDLHPNFDDSLALPTTLPDDRMVRTAAQRLNPTTPGPTSLPTTPP